MEGQKDDVLNLFYLFNEGDLYKVKEDLPLLMVEKPKINLSVNEDVSFAEIPDTIAVAKTNEQPQPIEPELEVAIPKEETAGIIIKPKEVAPMPESKTEPVSVVEQPSIEQKLAEKPPKADVREPIIAETELTKIAHSIFLVVSESRSVSLNVNDEAFLEKVLQAVGVSLDKVTLINVNGLTNPDYHYIFREKQVRQFISFGVPMEELNLYLPLLPYEVKLFHGIQFLYTDGLEGIRTDIERKKWLWTALKQMFGMK